MEHSVIKKPNTAIPASAYVIAGVLSGGIGVLGLSFIAAIAIGYWAQAANPDDPTAGSVAIVPAILAGPLAILGSLLGGAAGYLLNQYRQGPK